MPRAARRLPVVVLLALGALLAAAAPASAHAILIRSAPVQGSTLPVSPEQVAVGFSESVGTDPTSLQVLDGAGRRVDAGDVRHSGGDRVVIDVTPNLPRGTYVVAWHVVSADSHPVSGAFSFGVRVAPDAAVAAPTRSGSKVVGVLAGMARTAETAGLALLVGGCYFLLALWPAGLGRAGPRRLVLAGWVTTVAASTALLMLKGPYGAGLGLSSVISWTTLSGTLGSRYGHLVALRILLLVLAVPLLRGLGPTFRSGRPELAALAAATVLTQAAVGHAGVGSGAWLAVVSQAVHVASASVWIGGLAMLALFLLRRPSAPELADVLPRWSRLAIAAVAAIVLSGVYQAWREVGTLPALPATSFGRLLILKVALVAVMLSLGWLAQRWVSRRYRPVVFAAVDSQLDTAQPGRSPATAEVKRQRRSVGLEVLIAAAVLVVTALLVNAAPARTSYAPPFGQSVQAGPLTVRLRVSPTRTGAETVHAYTFDRQGRIAPVAEVTGELSLPAQRLGPLAVSFSRTGPGHVTSSPVAVPFPGVWQLRVTVRVDELNQYVTTVFYRVR